MHIREVTRTIPVNPDVIGEVRPGCTAARPRSLTLCALALVTACSYPSEAPIDWSISGGVADATTLGVGDSDDPLVPIATGNLLADPLGVTRSPYELPTVLFNQGDPAKGQPGCPSCSTSILVKDDESEASLRLYFLNGGEDLGANIEVRLFLDIGGPNLIMLKDLTLIDDNAHMFALILDEPRKWAEVRSAEIKIVPQ